MMKAYQYWMAATGLLLLWLNSEGQGVSLVKLPMMPTSGHVGDFFLHEGSGILYQYSATGWEQRLVERVDSVSQCCGHLVVHTKAGQYLFNYLGKLRSEYPTSASCGPEGLLFMSLYHWCLISQRMQIVELERNFHEELSVPLYANYLGGRVCMSSWDGNSRAKDLVMIKSATPVGWGMRDLLGNWVIEPIYDAPFFFKNSRATVEHYGVSFEIDETGKRIE